MGAEEEHRGNVVREKQPRVADRFANNTEALQVVGSNTVVLVPFSGAPGIIEAGTAAGRVAHSRSRPGSRARSRS
jgi:hypothetical protein